jgi:hypothetical protein
VPALIAKLAFILQLLPPSSLSSQMPLLGFKNRFQPPKCCLDTKNSFTFIFPSFTKSPLPPPKWPVFYRGLSCKYRLNPLFAASILLPIAVAPDVTSFQKT